MALESTHLAPGRNYAPRVVTEGVLDGDAVVYELFPLQTVAFDGRTSTIQSIPFPVFDSDAYGEGVLSVMVKSHSILLSGSELRVRIQNAIQSEDDPAAVFAENGAFATIGASTPGKRVLTVAWPVVGPSCRLCLEWSQVTVLPASVTMAVWLTLRRA